MERIADMNPYLFEVDVRDNQARYNDYIRQAQQDRLVRAAQAAEQDAEQPVRTGSLLARLFATLATRRTARAVR
jgi:hypothetical protein